MKKKLLYIGISILGCALLCFGVLNRALPIVRAKESFREKFPVEKFYAKRKEPTPLWVERQIARDFSDFLERGVSQEAIAKTHAHILEKLGPQASFHHYRILDQKLYKWTADGEKLAFGDTTLEKALKTLLIYAPVPDVDFILCSMDGLPEPYIPEDAFRLEDLEFQAPIFAQAKLDDPLTSCVVLIPDQFSLHPNWQDLTQEIFRCNQKISWEEKRGVAVWRGGLTDIGVPNGSSQFFDVRMCPRFQIAKCSRKHPDLVDASVTWGDAPEGIDLEKEAVLGGALTHEEHLHYKYLPVLNGHMCTYPGYQWRLLSNSVCFKQESKQVQWFYGALTPYVHYLPIAQDMNDLPEKVLWAHAHEAEILGMIQKAQDFAQNHLMLEDNYLYLLRALTQLAEIERIDFQRLKRETAQDPHWTCIQYRKRIGLQKSLSKILVRTQSRN